MSFSELSRKLILCQIEKSINLIWNLKKHFKDVKNFLSLLQPTHSSQHGGFHLKAGRKDVGNDEKDK
jgi:hypothetical protein